jgi:beta-xylosidase
LDPSASNYKVTDQGMVVDNGPVATTPFGAIDPAPFFDASGNLWVEWGGGFTSGSSSLSLWATRLDNKTGLPDTTDPGWKPPAHPGWPTGEEGAKEGSYMQYHNGYYYLFWNTGGCCSGISSTYTIHVARSASLTSPTFTASDRIFYGPGPHTTGGINGPGHMGIYNCGDVWRFTYHYYPTGGSILGDNILTWGSDGWPVAGAQATTPLKLPCTTTEIGPAQGNALAENEFQVRKTSTGYELWVPQTGASAIAQVLDLRGKTIGTESVAAGWSPIPAKMLVPGVNAIRLTSGNLTTTGLIFNNR